MANATSLAHDEEKKKKKKGGGVVEENFSGRENYQMK